LIKVNDDIMNILKSNTHLSSTYISGIDGLRALAVLSVMLFHLDAEFLPGGFSGVDIFFVISGYVVSSSLARELDYNFLQFTIRFYARRILRIFPALIVCLIVITIVNALIVPISWLSNANKYTGLYAFFGVSNFALIWFNDGYFSPRVEFNPFTHTWSLAVEEQFYMVFPFVFYLWMHFKERNSMLSRTAIWLLPSLLLASLLFSWYQTTESPDKAFYLLPSRFWELACGALLYRFHSQGMLLSKAANTNRLYIFTGLTLTVAGLIFSDQSAFPFPWALLSVAGSLFLIMGVVNKLDDKSFVQCALESRLFVHIGKMSYSLYLWHWPVYVFLRWTTGLESLYEIAFAVVLTFILASLSYRYVEGPVRKNKFISARSSWQIVTIGIGTIFVSLLFSGLVIKSQPVISLSVTKDIRTWYPLAWPADVNPSMSQNFKDKKLFVLGDSHAVAYSTMVQKLSDEHGVKVITYSTGGCGVADFLKSVESKNVFCKKEIESKIIKIESQAAQGDIVFLASLRMNRLGDQWETFSGDKVANDLYSDTALKERKLAFNDARDFIQRLSELSVNIIIDAPMPIFKSPPFRCSDWFNRMNPVCASGFEVNRKYLLHHRKPVMDSLKLLEQDFSNLIVWDPLQVLCKLDECSAYDESGPLFFDGDHLSAHGNLVLYSSFKSVVESAWFKS